MPGVVESPTDHEAYQSWGRGVGGTAGNPEFERSKGLASGFGTQYGTALGQQQGAYDAFGAMAAGQGPSLAQGQLQQGLSQAQQQAVGAAQSVRGGNMAGGQMAALQASTALGGQAAMGAAQLRQQEQLAAMQAQADMANAMAQQGLQGQMGMEGLYQQGLSTQFQGDIDYRLGARGLREQERAGRSQRIHNAVGATPLGWFGSDPRMKTNIQPASPQAIQSANPYGEPSNANRILGGLGQMQGGGEKDKGGGLGSILGLVSLLSDERTKRNVQPGNLSASQAVGELDPYTFEYEAGYGQPGGMNVGVMADDMERAYPQAVAEDERGLKHINTAQATGLALASSADQEKRIRQMEAALGMATSQGASSGRPEDARFEGRGQQGAQQEQQPQRRFAYAPNIGPIPADTDREQGRAATMGMLDSAGAMARQQDADAARMQQIEGRQVSDESRRMAMAVGAAPQQRELGANSLQDIDRNYGYRDEAWADSWEASPASAASSAAQRLYSMENPGPQIRQQGPMPSARPQNFRFVQPAQGLAAQPQQVAYDPRFDTYQGYGGRMA